MAIFFWILAALWVLALVGAVRNEGDATQRLEPNRDSPLEAELDVIVPARNEEETLAPLLESLLAQKLPPARILVVDDRSEDGTARVIDSFAARDPRVRRVSGNGPGEGWTGKTAALTEGFEVSTAPWVLFVDADVRLAPHNLHSALSEVIRRAWDGISLLGRWEVPTLGARMLHAVIGGFVRGTHPLNRVNDAWRKDAFLNGQYLLIRRASFEDLGGWGAVRGEVLEDVALARRAKTRGVRIGVLRANALMSVVPYRSLRETWAGYRKNFVAGAGGAVPALVAAAAIFTGAVLPWIALGGYLVVPGGAMGPVVAAGAACAASLLFRVGTARAHHHRAWEAVLAPLGNAVFVALIVTAVVGRWRGAPALWKGRPV